MSSLSVTFSNIFSNQLITATFAVLLTFAGSAASAPIHKDFGTLPYVTPVEDFAFHDIGEIFVDSYEFVVPRTALELRVFVNAGFGEFDYRLYKDSFEISGDKSFLGIAQYFGYDTIKPDCCTSNYISPISGKYLLEIVGTGSLRAYSFSLGVSRNTFISVPEPGSLGLILGVGACLLAHRGMRMKKYSVGGQRKPA